jgi:AraC-like DNA-binding protein
MPAASGDFQTLRLSADTVPARERLPMLREFYGPLIARLDMEPVADEPVRFELTARALANLTLARITSSPMRSRRTRKLIADGDDDVCFCISDTAGHLVSHLGRELQNEADTGLLFSHADPFDCTVRSGSAVVYNITLPRKLMVEMVPHLEDRFMRPVMRETEALQLLTRYVQMLTQQDQALATAELRHLAVTHVYDLVALSLGAAGDASEIATGRGLRAVRLAAIKADILANLTDHGLSLTAVAARHRVTPRYVQALFETEGATFSQFLLRQRLACVRRMLCDPRQAGRGISAIAYDAGFGDLSHFNRAFRRQYGATPSDVRADTARGGDAG